MDNALFIVIGLLSGVFAGLFGVGGGVVIVPMFVLIAKMTQKMATGTSLALLLPPLGLMGVITYWRAGQVNVKAAALTAAGLFFGAWVGSRISVGLSDIVLRRAFAVVLVAVATRLWFSAG